MTEEWLPIDDFPAYCVSNLGNVKRTATITGKPLDRVLRPTLREGYRVVVLCDRGRRIIRRIGRMVAKAFLPNPNNLFENGGLSNPDDLQGSLQPGLLEEQVVRGQEEMCGGEEEGNFRNHHEVQGVV